MKLSPSGATLIQYYEQLRLSVYLCSAGVPTIGWGHTGKDVKLGMAQITKARADELFLTVDVPRFEREVTALLKVPVTQAQFDALVSFAFNLGSARLAGSTLLKRVNAGNFAEGANQFLLWNLSGGKRTLGLVRRRTAERLVFLGTPVDQALATAAKIAK